MENLEPKLYKCHFTNNTNNETQTILVPGTPQTIKAKANEIFAALVERGTIEPTLDWKLHNTTEIYAFVANPTGAFPVYQPSAHATASRG
jgi:hypothetical protein